MESIDKRQCISSREIEFLAEHELMEIVPYFNLRENNGILNFIGGDYGPFQAGTPTKIPLWLAVMLKELNKCRIMAPEWLTVEYFTSKLEREQESDIFEPLPFHYLEISSLLFKCASDDIERVEEIRSILEDLQSVRQDKIRNGLAKISGDVQNGGTAYAIQMNNVSAMEINSVRQFMIASLNKFYSLAELNRDDANIGTGDSQSQSQVYDRTVGQSSESVPRTLRRYQ